MVGRNELKLREYDGKDCVSFKMKFEDEDLGMRVDCIVWRDKPDSLKWTMDAVADFGMGFKHLYSFESAMPKQAYPLEDVAGSMLLKLSYVVSNEQAAMQVFESMARKKVHEA